MVLSGLSGLRKEYMKNVQVTVMAGLLAAAILLTGTSCKKEQKAAAPPPTPEQKAAIEEIKKDVQAARTTIAAQVNGVDISMHDLVGEMNAIADREKAQDNGKKSRAVEQVRKEALDNLIFKELAIQEAVKQGIVVTPERVDTVVRLMKEQMGGEDAFRKYLDERQMTEADLRRRIERSHLFEMITGKEIYQKVKVDDKDVRAEYEKNMAGYKDGAGRQLSYEESANFIRRKLMSQKGMDMKKTWAKKLRNNASGVVFKEGMK
jgi:foldase protein PrsA